MAFFGDFVLTINEAELAAILADFYAASNDQRPNDFTPTNPSVINTVNVAIAPPIPTTDNLQPTIEFAQAIVAESVAEFGKQETPLVVTLLETLDDAGDLAGFLLRPVPAFWFGGIRIIMNGLTDAQRTTISNLDIGSQISVTKTFPNSTPPTVTQVMALEGISHDISPDRHIVTLYPNPARIYTLFIVGGFTTTTTRTNLVTNPSFEVTTSPWGSSRVVLSRSSTYSYSGSYSALGTCDTNGIAFTFLTGTPISAGVQYTFSGYCRSSVSRLTRVFVQWFNGGTYISDMQGALTLSSTTGFTRFSVTGTAPAGANNCTILTQQLSAVIGDQHYWDGFLLEASSSALPYFDGTYADTYTGYTLTSQGWNGTADASTSTATWGLDSSFVGSELNDDTKGLG